MSTNYENDDWVIKFITFDGKDGKYIAWDETQANEIGRFYSKLEAKKAVLKYVKTLNKKENNMDFKVGDEVVCLLNGEGVVDRIMGYDISSVCVKFIDGSEESYYLNGKFQDKNKFPSLFHKGTVINIKPADIERHPWVNIYLNSTGAIFGKEYATKQDAERSVENWKGDKIYIDTIQLKQKGE